MIHFCVVSETFSEPKQRGAPPLLAFGAVSWPSVVSVPTGTLIAPGSHGTTQ